MRRTVAETEGRRATPTWLSRISLRARVTGVAALITASGLVLASIFLVVSLRSGLIGGLDDAAQVRAAQVADGLRTHPDLGLVVGPRDDNTAVQVLERDGRVLQSSSRSTDSLARLPVPPGPHVGPDVTLAGVEYRVLTQREGARTIVVASSLQDVEESTSRLIASLAIGGPVLLVVISGAVWLLLGYTLRTLERPPPQGAQLSAPARAPR